MNPVRVRSLGLPLLTLLLIVEAAGAAARPSGAAPAQGDAAVTVDSVMRDAVDVPGAPEPHTPALLNRALAFRYHGPETRDPSDVLVLIPGLHSGPNTMDILARVLIARAPGTEVWIVSPRASLLQDRRGIEAALDHRNPDFALGYYYGNLAIEGQTFHRLTGADVPYAAYWGLDVHLRDVHAIVQEVRRRYPDTHIVLGGHSLGGILTGLYAGYDFGRVPGDPRSSSSTGQAGARDLSGLLFLDGLPLKTAFRVTPAMYLHGFWTPWWGRFPGLHALTAADPAKRAAPFTDVAGLSRTKESILFDVLSVYAYLRPEAASYFPFFPRRGRAITNEALVAGILSDEMQPQRLLRVSVEPPLGVFQPVPDPASIEAAGFFDLQSGRPAAGDTLIRLTAEGRTGARVHLRALVTAALRPGGDFTQWYFPWRLVLDLALAKSLDTSDAFAGHFMSLTRVSRIALPILVIGAEDGLIRSPRMTAFYRNHIATPRRDVSVTILPEYTHLDVELADPNSAVPLILDWLKTARH